MRAAMYYNNKDVRLQEAPDPVIGAGEVLARIEASGLCGSDVMEWYRIKKAPLILGHEIAGIIEEVGEGLEKYKPGQRITAIHHVPCNSCHYCLSGHHTCCDMLRTTTFDPGGFCEKVRLKDYHVDRGIYVLPDNVSFEMGTFVEPVSCVLRGQRLAGFKPGNSVLVIGSGISGLLHVAVARACGAGLVAAVDVNDFRLEKAGVMGADVLYKASDDIAKIFTELNNGRGADLVIVCTSAMPAMELSVKAVGRGGSVLFFAPTLPNETLALPVEDIWKNEVTVLTSYGGAPGDVQQALKLISTLKMPLEELITHRLPLEKAVEGFKLVAEAGDSIKVIIEPQK